MYGLLFVRSSFSHQRPRLLQERESDVLRQYYRICAGPTKCGLRIRCFDLDQKWTPDHNMHFFLFQTQVVEE